MELTARPLYERHGALPASQGLACHLLSPQLTIARGWILETSLSLGNHPKSLELCCAEPWGDYTAQSMEEEPEEPAPGVAGSGQQQQNVPDLEFPGGSSRTSSSRTSDLLIKPSTPNSQAAFAGPLQRKATGRQQRWRDLHAFPPGFPRSWGTQSSLSFLLIHKPFLFLCNMIRLLYRA